MTTLPTLEQLDDMSIQASQELPRAVRDALLDHVLDDGRKVVSAPIERQRGLMCDYIEEDLSRLLKLRAVRISPRGIIPYLPGGEIPTLDPATQFRLVFERLTDMLTAAGSTMQRITSLTVFLKNMDYWPEMNRVYREFITCNPVRAVVGADTARTCPSPGAPTQLLSLPYQIEIVSVVAYKVR